MKTALIILSTISTISFSSSVFASTALDDSLKSKRAEYKTACLQSPACAKALEDKAIARKEKALKKIQEKINSLSSTSKN